MSQSMWRVDNKNWEIHEVACIDGEPPASDADGVPIHENTHFTTRADALKRLTGEARMLLKIAHESLRVAQQQLSVADADATDAVKVFARVMQLHRETEGAT